jgi:hypothetical protein
MPSAEEPIYLSSCVAKQQAPTIEQYRPKVFEVKSTFNQPRYYYMGCK